MKVKLTLVISSYHGNNHDNNKKNKTNTKNKLDMLKYLTTKTRILLQILKRRKRRTWSLKHPKPHDEPSARSELPRRRLQGASVQHEPAASPGPEGGPGTGLMHTVPRNSSLPHEHGLQDCHDSPSCSRFVPALCCPVFFGILTSGRNCTYSDSYALETSRD